MSCICGRSVHEVLGHISDSASIPTHLSPFWQSRCLCREPSKQYSFSVQVDQRDHSIQCPSSSALDFSITILDVKSQARTTHNRNWFIARVNNARKNISVRAKDIEYIKIYDVKLVIDQLNILAIGIRFGLLHKKCDLICVSNKIHKWYMTPPGFAHYSSDSETAISSVLCLVAGAYWGSKPV